MSDESELETLCAEISSQHHSGESPDSPSRPCCTFTYVTMTGEEVELCQGGRSLTVRYGKLCSDDCSAGLLVIITFFELYFYETRLVYSLMCACLCVLSWENKDVYARAVRSLRLRELQNVECMTAVRAGLGSIIPLQLLTMLIPLEMELRTCGLPYINLEFLKVLHIFV